MRTQVKSPRSEVALARLLEALEQELLDCSDEEILQVVRDLGMDPQMKGSAVFEGLKYPSQPQLSDFFDVESIMKLRSEAKRLTDTCAEEAAARTSKPSGAPGRQPRDKH